MEAAAKTRVGDGADRGAPVALDLPGPSRRVRIEPVRLPDPARGPGREPLPEPAPDPVPEGEPGPGPDPATEPDPIEEPAPDRASSEGAGRSGG